MAKKKEREAGKGYKKLQVLADKAKVELEKILKIVSKEADLGSRFLKEKIAVMGLDSDIEKKYIELGKEAYSLIDKGSITEPSLKAISSEIDRLYDKLEEARKQIGSLKEQMVKAGR